jgi:hypothetical protein
MTSQLFIGDSEDPKALLRPATISVDQNTFYWTIEGHGIDSLKQNTPSN